MGGRLVIPLDTDDVSAHEMFREADEARSAIEMAERTVAQSS